MNAGQHLNYCRQIHQQCKTTLEWPSAPGPTKAAARHAIDLCLASQKFLLPPNGFLFVDKEFRGLDESDELRLPYDFTALEFECNAPDTSKTVLFCRRDEDRIYLTTALCERASNRWWVADDIALPTTGYLDRARGTYRILTPGEMRDFQQYGAGVLLSLLNALSCSNVYIERSDPKSGPKKKGALPFDSYHILTIRRPSETGRLGMAQPHRSPREHLRRGHIRRYENGIRIWINATVVNAGVGGKVSKDYRMAA